MRKKFILSGLAFALGEASYIALVALFMSSVERFIGPGPNILGVITFLLVFVFSAAVSGALVVGRPIFLYLENRKKEAVELFIITLGWIFLLLVIFFVSLVLARE